MACTSAPEAQAEASGSQPPAKRSRNRRRASPPGVVALCVSRGPLDADDLRELRGPGRPARASSSLNGSARLPALGDGESEGGATRGDDAGDQHSAGESESESASSEDEDGSESETESGSDSEEEEDEECVAYEDGESGNAASQSADGECRLLFFLADDGRVRMAPLHVDRLRSLSRKCSNPNRNKKSKKTASVSNDFFADL